MSAAERPDVIRKQFEEEVKEGLMTKVSVKKAREEWGEHLVVASLGAVKKNIEDDEWRMVYDATHGVRVNNRIRVLDQIRFPAWPDLVAFLDEMAGDEMGVHFLATFDASKAHRRIPRVRTEWGLLASQADSSAGAVPADDDVLYVNTVGTVGVSSAGYWWSRLATLLLIVIHVLLGLSTLPTNCSSQTTV